MLACLVGAFFLCFALVRSPFGAVLRGIRENEAKTIALGYNTRLYKIAVVAVSYALGGLAGALYAPFAGFANTELLFWLLSGQVLIMVIVGGSGTLVGPILGAAFFMLMEHQLSSWTEAWALYFGLIFIAFVLFALNGTGDQAAAHAVSCGVRRGPDVALLELDGVTRRYGALVALDQVAAERRGRRGARRHRPQRRGQDDAVQRRHRHGQAERGRDPVRGPRSPAWQATRSAGWASRAPSRSPRCFPKCRRARMRGWRPRPAIRDAGNCSAAPASSRRPKRAPTQRSSSSASPASPTGLPDCSRTPARLRRARGARRADAGLSVEETAQAVETLARFLKASRMTVLLVEHDMEVVFRLAHPGSRCCIAGR